MKSVGMTNSKWFICDQCGFDYPVKYLTRQRGLKLCTYLPCADEPGGQSQADDPRVLTQPQTPFEGGDGKIAANEGLSPGDPGYIP